MELTAIYVGLSFILGAGVGFGLGIYYVKKKMESKMQEMMGGMGEMLDMDQKEGGMFE